MKPIKVLHTQHTTILQLYGLCLGHPGYTGSMVLIFSNIYHFIHCRPH